MAKEAYRRMLKLMPNIGEPVWSVYVLRCGDGSYYTGIAKTVQERLAAHQSGKGAAYTRTHLPVSLIHEENGFTRSEALVREARIKALPRPKKHELVYGAPTRDTFRPRRASKKRANKP